MGTNILLKNRPIALAGRVRSGVVINRTGFLNGLATTEAALRTRFLGCLAARDSALATDFAVRSRTVSGFRILGCLAFCSLTTCFPLSTTV